MPLNCSCFKRSGSPTESPIKLEDATDRPRRFSVSTNYTRDNSVYSDLTPPFMHDVFNETTASFDPITPHSAQFMIRRRSSLQAIHHAARKLKDKLSRDSHASSAISPHATRAHVRSDITDIQSVVQDKDAVVIKTPGSSLPRSDRHEYGGAIQISPQQLRKILDRSRTPSPQPNRQPTQLDVQSLDHVQPITGLSKDGQTKVLSKMLTDRAGDIVAPQVEAASTPADTKARQRKYTFPDTPKRLDRSTPGRGSLHEQAADLKPRKASALSACVRGTDTLASLLTEGSNEHIAVEKSVPVDEDNLPASDTVHTHDGQSIEDRPSWTRGASGVFKDSHKTTRPTSLNSAKLVRNQQDFGGVDGSSGSRTRSHSDGSNARSVHLYNIQISRRLASSNQHLLSSASSPELRAVSSSTLSWKTGAELIPFPPTRRPSSSEFSALEGPIGFHAPKRRDGSSQYSVYSARTNLFSNSQLGLPPLSRQESKSPLILDTSAVNSLSHSRNQSLEALARKHPHTNQGQHLRRALTVAKTRNKVNDGLNTLEQGALARSQSLASGRAGGNADTVRRAHTASSTRYFSQADIDDIYREIALRTPPSSRVVSRFDGPNDNMPLGSSLLNPNQVGRVSSVTSSRLSNESRRTLSINMSPKRKPSLVMGVTPLGSSVWDKAIRENAKEDARIMLQNPGSFSEEILRRRSMRLQRTSESLLPLPSIENSETSGTEPLPAFRSSLRQLPTYNRPPSSGSSISSWSRYPSHTRQQRIDSPATEEDAVYSKDFAPVTPSKKQILSSRSLPSIKSKSPDKEKTTPTKRFQRRIKKAHSSRMIQIKSSWKDLKRTKLLELSGKLAIDDARGHRSSISDGTAGAGTKMPELEMLSPLPMSPVHESFEGGYFPSLEDLSKPIVPITQNISLAAAPPAVKEEEMKGSGKKGKKEKNSSKKSKVQDQVSELESKVKKQVLPSFATKTKVGTTTPKHKIPPPKPWNQLYDSCVKLPFSPSVSSFSSPPPAKNNNDLFSPSPFGSTAPTASIQQWNWANAAATSPSGPKSLFSPQSAKGIVSTGGVNAVNVFGSGMGPPRAVEFNLDAMIASEPRELVRGKEEGKEEFGLQSPRFVGQVGAQQQVEGFKLQSPPLKAKKEFTSGALPLPKNKKKKVDTDVSADPIATVAATQATSASKVETAAPTGVARPIFNKSFTLGQGMPGESGGGLMERRKAKAQAVAKAKMSPRKMEMEMMGFPLPPASPPSKVKEVSVSGGLLGVLQEGTGNSSGRRKISEVDPLAMVEVGGVEDEFERRQTVDVDPMDILGLGSIGRSKRGGLDDDYHE